MLAATKVSHESGVNAVFNFGPSTVPGAGLAITQVNVLSGAEPDVPEEPDDPDNPDDPDDPDVPEEPEEPASPPVLVRI